MKYLVIPIIFLYACASVGTLSGGDLDITPPKIVDISVDSASTNVRERVFTFTFDEYVTLKQVNDNFLISPNQQKSPTFKLKKKKLTVTLNDSLLDNTTYTFQFNGSVVDLNESNPLNYKYIFSTGAYIDSAKYSGYIFNYMTKDIYKDCNIQLYDIYKDSFFIKTKPSFLAKTDEYGFYEITNLPNRKFTALAISDNNKNLLWSPDEPISQYREVLVSDSTSNDSFYLFTSQNLDKLKPKLDAKTPGIYTFTANQPFFQDSITLLFNKNVQPYTINTYKDTITTYFTKSIDTLNIHFIHTTDTHRFNDYQSISNYKYSNSLEYKQANSNIVITSRTPIKKIDSSSITLIADDSIPIPFQLTQLDKQSIKLEYTKNNSSKIKIISEPITIVDVYNQELKKDSFTFNISDTEPSSVSITLNADSSQKYLLRIVQKESIIRQFNITGSYKVNLTNLLPGNYRAITITDSNDDGLWNSGNIWINKAPEPLQVSKEFEVRQNWDNELIINVE